MTILRPANDYLSNEAISLSRGWIILMGYLSLILIVYENMQLVPSVVWTLLPRLKGSHA